MTEIKEASAPKVHFTLILAGLALAFLTFVHLIALTPLTHSIDDIKYVTMYLTGALSLIGAGALLAVRVSRPPVLIVSAHYLSYLVVMLLSTLFGAADYAKWLGWQQVLMYTCLAGLFFLGASLCTTHGLVRGSVRFWVFVALFTCGFGLFHYAGGVEPISASMEASFEALRQRDPNAERGPMLNLMKTFADNRRMFSTILNSQFYGNFLGLLLPICLAASVINYEEFREAGQKGEKTAGPLGWMFASATAAVFCVACIFFTFSKISMLLIPVGLVLFPILITIFTPYKVLKLPAWPLLLALASIVVATLIFFSWGDLKNEVSALQQSTGSRSIIFGGAWEIFKSSPILGTGPGSFRVEFPQFRSPDYHLNSVSNLTLYAHNRFLDLLAETGILGFITYVGMLISLIVFAFIGIKKTESDTMKVIIIGYLVGFVLYFIGNSATPMMRWPIGAFTAHLALGLFAGIVRTANEGEYASAPQKFSPSGNSIFGASILVVGIVTFPVAASYSNGYFRGAATDASGRGQLGAADVFAGAARGTNDQNELQYFKFKEKEHLEKAGEYFEKAIEYNPTFITSYYRNAHVVNRLGDIEKVPFVILQEALQRNPNLQVSEQNWREARQSLEAAIEKKKETLEIYDVLDDYAPDYSEIHLNRGIINYSLGSDYILLRDFPGLTDVERKEAADRARECFLAAREPMRIAGEMSNKISVHSMAGRIYAAVSESLPDDDPEILPSRIAAAEAYGKTRDLPYSTVIQGKSKREQMELERAQKRQGATQSASLFVRSQEWARAAEAYQELVKIFPHSMDFRLRAIDCLIQAEDKPGALELVNLYLEDNPIEPALLVKKIDVISHNAKEPTEVEAVALESIRLIEMNERLGGIFNNRQMARIQELRTTAEANLSS